MEEFLTVKQVAKLLNLRERAIRYYMEKRLIPYIKLPGGSVRFSREDVQEWLKECYRPAKLEAKEAFGKGSS